MAPIPSDGAGPDSAPGPTGDATGTGRRARHFPRLNVRFPRLKLGVPRLARSRRAWAVVGVITLLGAVSWHRCGIRGCPAVATLASYQPGGASLVLDRNGQTVASLGPVDHAVVEIGSLPAYVPAAFIAVEDKRFYRHHGVDWRRVLGASFANLKAGGARQGSSTITMQLTRNLFPDRIRASDKTLRRKLLEVRVAREIERRFSKQEILELYLNHIYFGAGAYGIEAASRQFFDRPASKLTLEQAAMLAALPKAPSHYDPRHDADAARSRRDLVLSLMADQGRITAEEAEAARARPLRVASARNRRRTPSPRAAYYVQHIRDLLEDKLGEDLYSRPLRIHTTLDLRVQDVAEEELEKQIRRVENGAFGAFDGPTRAQFKAGSAQTEYLQGAVVVMDQATGDVLALVGGRSATESSFDRAIDGQRQAGSAFKPFVYATALSRGWSPNDILDDSPYRLVSGGRTWEPRNADGDFLGPVTVRDALVFSRNVPTIRLAERVGVSNIEHLAKDAGLDADLDGTPVEALGVEDVSPLELTAAYSAFAAEGTAVHPRFILSVEDPDGKVLWQPAVERNRVMTPATAFIMTDLLRDVVDRGTGRHVRYAGYRGIAAGKTGTTNDGADTWFVGYTPRLTASVWVGFDKPRPIAAHASGGPIAAQVWGRMMNRIPDLAGRSEWQRPQQVVTLSVDPETGLALADGCEPANGDARTELFLRGSEPETVCPDARPGASWVDRVAGRLGEWWNGFLGDRPVQVAAGNEDRESRRSDDWNGDDRNGRRPVAPPVRDGWPDGNWTVDLRDALEESVRQRAEERDQVLEWLDDLSDAVDDIDLRDRDSRRIQNWIDGIKRSVEQADRAARRQDPDALQRWMDGMIDRMGGQNLDSDTRRQLRRELMRAAQNLQ